MKPKLLAIAVCCLLLLAGIDVFGKSIEERQWIRMESQNFTIHSALGKSKTRSLLKQLEAVRSLFHAGETNLPGSFVPTLIFAIDTRNDLRELGLDPAKIAGVFVPGLRENTVIIRGASAGDESDVIIHEYIHYLHSSDGRFPYPKWYREGYAEYVSTSSLERRRFNVGQIDEDRAYALAAYDWLPIEKIIDTTHFYALADQTSVYMFYCQSWLLTHYLFNRDGGDQYVMESLAKYATALRDGATEIEAFEQAFGMTLAELDEELGKYHKKGSYKYFWVPADTLLADFDPVATRLTTEEISVELAELILGLESQGAATDRLTKARQLFEIGLASKATRARAEIGIAYLLENDGDAAAAEEHLVSGASLAADDFLVQLDAARFWLNRLKDTTYEHNALLSKSEPYLKRALTIDRNNPEVLATTGQYLLASGDTDQAIQILVAAADRAPAVSSLRWTLAKLLFDQGRLAEALLYAKDVLMLSHGRSTQVDAARLLIEQIELAHESPAEGSN